MIPGSYRPQNLTDLSVPVASLLALVLSLLTSGLLFFISTFEQVNNTTLALIFLLPVGLCASLWGLIPGSLAAIFSFLAFNFFFIPELYTFQVKQTEDLIVLAAFLGVAIVISELTGRVRRNLASANARELEAVSLYEFNNLLSALLDVQSAAKIIIEKIELIIRPIRIELLIETLPVPIFLARGNSSTSTSALKPVIFPLQSSRELIGEIRVWQNRPLSVTEERLLKIFASQSILTIERIKLSEEARKISILEESDRLKSSLLSSVSHELRSPLAAIKTSVSSLRAEEVDWKSDARKELLTTVEEEIDHLNVLVGNLLDMSRIEAGVMKPQKKPNILIEIISAVLGRLSVQTQQHKIILDISEDLPMLNVDYVQVQQVFTNLLTNSLKYSPVGSSIEISAEDSTTGFVTVKLRNHSMQVPESDLGKIFNKFYRINPSERITGAGLGLSICKGIIEAHGGKIWAENISDGLIFIFTLPVN